jgi:hypothetical protein
VPWEESRERQRHVEFSERRRPRGMVRDEGAGTGPGEFPLRMRGSGRFVEVATTPETWGDRDALIPGGGG